MKADRVNAIAEEKNIDRRTIRAPLQEMAIDIHADVDGIAVHSSSENTYEVNLDAGTFEPLTTSRSSPTSSVPVIT